MIRLGLIGHPLGHSLSPQIHAAAFRSCELDGEYSLFPIPPEDVQGLESLLARVRSGEVRGLNVTIPHKQNVIPLLDELTPTAESIGAVNTIHLQQGKLVGDNTDAGGFLADLKAFLHQRSDYIPGAALVLGAGGSARAVVQALLQDGWHVTIAARRPEQAEELAGRFEALRVVEYSDRDLRDVPVKLIVNTTPVGMLPNHDASPWPEKVPFPPDAAVYDLVYNPRKTKLVRAASSQGRPATTGLGMLIEQAALAFEIWTGCRPSRQALVQSLDE